VKRICIAGGGSAALIAARALEEGLYGRRNVRAVFLHDGAYADWQPLLPEIASGTTTARTARLRLDELLGDGHVQCVDDRLTGLDLERRTVLGAGAEYHFDLLILAPEPELAPIAGGWLPYARVADAARISRSVLALAAAPVADARSQRILVRGQGRRAIELATALAWGCDAALASRALVRFDISLWADGDPDVGDADIQIVREETDAAVKIDARQGRAPAWLRSTELAQDDDGRLLVADNLAVRGRHDVFAIGPLATRSSGPAWPATSVTDWQMGNLAADNARMELVGASHEPLIPWPIEDVTRLGPNDGRARVAGMSLRGELARSVARLLVAGTIPTFTKKLAVLGEWARAGRTGGEWATLPLPRGS
jgi:NADH dehydrogenase FAD-containing subunit